MVDEPDSLKYPMPLPLSITGEVRCGGNVGLFLQHFFQESGIWDGFPCDFGGFVVFFFE